MKPSRAAAAVLAAFFAACALRAWRIPAGDAPDERAHAAYVEHLAERGTLPVVTWPEDPHGYQMMQPPLYYFGASLVLKASAGLDPLSRLKATRLYSAFLQTAALFFIWLLAKNLYADDADALGPVLLAASLPMFAFMGGAVGNDPSVNLAGAAMLWATLAWGRSPNLGRDLGLGALFGAAFLCKATALPVIAACSLYMLWPAPAVSRRSWVRLLAVGGALLLVSGWFYARNMGLYGDPWGYSRIKLYDTERYGLAGLPEWAWLYFQSFWGRFGQMTRPMALPVYILLAGLTAAALTGWLRSWRTLAATPGRRLLLLALGLSLVQNFLYGFVMTHQPQGRHLFVALGAWAVLFFDGLGSWARELAPSRKPLLRWVFGAAALAVQFAAWSAA